MSRWLCRLGWHRWAKRVNDSGEAYLVCRRCHKEDDVPTRPRLGGIS